MVESSIKQMYWEKHGVSDLPRGVGTSGQQSGDQGYNRGDHPREDPSETETWNYSWHQESRLDQGCCLRGSYGAVYLVLWFLSMGCVFLPSWAQNITFVCWSMNHPPPPPLSIWWKSWPFSPGTCSSAKTHEMVLMMSRGYQLSDPPVPGSEIKDLLNLGIS